MENIILRVILFVVGMIAPLIMWICGKWLQNDLCNERNQYIGYRTELSLKNDNTWKFANEYCGKLWIFSGKMLLLISLMIMILAVMFCESNMMICWIVVILAIIQSVVMIFSIIQVENALKENFDENGNRK